jgi:hypothetical protein
MTDILTFDILRQPRTVEEFLAWFDATEDPLIATKELMDLSRSAGGEVFKRYREEVMPFVPVAAHMLAGTGAVIRFPADTNRADVIAEINGRSTEYQITHAADEEYGQAEALRARALTAKGHVRGWGPITRIRGRNGQPDRFEEGPALGRPDLIMGKMKRMALQAISAKSKKGYPASTVLIVAIKFRFPSLRVPILEALAAECPPTSFASLLLVDASGRGEPYALRGSATVSDPPDAFRAARQAVLFARLAPAASDELGHAHGDHRKERQAAAEEKEVGQEIDVDGEGDAERRHS